MAAGAAKVAAGAVHLCRRAALACGSARHCCSPGCQLLWLPACPRSVILERALKRLEWERVQEKEAKEKVGGRCCCCL